RLAPPAPTRDRPPVPRPSTHTINRKPQGEFRALGDRPPKPKEATMQAKEVIKTALQSTQNMLSTYLGDLSDADLLVRPVPAANHIAWQLGHLIQSECDMCSTLGVKCP